MARTFFGLLGVAMALTPERVLEFFEKFALENPDDVTPKSWIIPAMRGEGGVYVLLALLGGSAYGRLMKIVGAVGIVVLLYPEKYLAFGAEIAYENAADVEWKDSFITVVRSLGGVFVLLAVIDHRKRTRDRRTENED